MLAANLYSASHPGKGKVATTGRDPRPSKGLLPGSNPLSRLQRAYAASLNRPARPTAHRPRPLSGHTTMVPNLIPMLAINSNLKDMISGPLKPTRWPPESR